MTDAEMTVNADENVAAFQTNNGQQIRIGDCVCLLPADPKAELYIAKVEKMYRDEKGKRLIQIRWYYRHKDLQHEPRSSPLKDEVYYTNYFDCQLVESVAKHCKVLTKGEYLRFMKDERRRSPEGTSEEDIFFYEFAYSAETGTFTRIDGPDAQYIRGPYSKQSGCGRGSTISVKALVDALVDLENTIPRDVKSACWTDTKRSVWTMKVNEGKNVNDIMQSLLELEDGFQLILSADGKSDVKSRLAWIKTITGNQSPESLLENIKHLKDYVMQRLNISSSNFSLGNDHDQSTIKLKKRKRNSMDILLKQSDRQVEDRLPLLQDFASEDLTNASDKHAGLITVGSIYEIDHKCLPPKAPIHLKSIRVVMVTEKTKVNVSVKFPSNLSLRKYFRNDAYESTSKTPQSHGQSLIGTHPALDEQFVMGPRLAEKVLFRPISCTAYVHQRHLESFWLVSGTLSPLQIQQQKHEYVFGEDQQVKSDQPINDMYDSIKQSTKVTNSAPAIDNSSKFPDDGTKDMTYSSSDVEGESVPIKWGVRRKVSFSRRHRNRNGVKVEKGVDHQTSQEADYSPEAKPRKRRPSTPHIGEEDVESFKIPSSSLKDKKSSILKLPRDMQGRWTSDRYRTAQLKLLDIMHEKGAAPGRPILRPALREEARKHIGDTGLLDHLLKHMTDTVISNGERFRRRHNAEGAMEYWLESAGLMEIRKQAGIEDPSWVPPPGWKPGDKVPMNGFSMGMTPSEAEEMKMLKEDVNKLKSELLSLSSAKATNITVPKTADGVSGQSDLHVDSAKILTEKLKDMKIEITNLRKDMDNIQNKCVEQNDQASNITEHGINNIYPTSNENRVENGFLQACGKMSRCNIIERLDKLEGDTQKFYQEAENNYKTLAAEKKGFENQLSEVFKIVGRMQEDMNGMLKFISQSKEISGKQNAIEDPSSAMPLGAVTGLSEVQMNEMRQIIPGKALSSTEKAEKCVGRCNVNEHTIIKPGDHIHATPSREEQARTGFRLCKPEGTFLWPNMGTYKSSHLVQIEDVLSPRQATTPPSASSENATAVTVYSSASSPNQLESSQKIKPKDMDLISTGSAGDILKISDHHQAPAVLAKEFSPGNTSASVPIKSPSKAPSDMLTKGHRDAEMCTQLSLSPNIKQDQTRSLPRKRPLHAPSDLISMYVCHLAAPRLEWAQNLSDKIAGPLPLPNTSTGASTSFILPPPSTVRVQSNSSHSSTPETAESSSQLSWLGLAPPASTAPPNNISL